MNPRWDESACVKTLLGRAIVQLIEPTANCGPLDELIRVEPGDHKNQKISTFTLNFYGLKSSRINANGSSTAHGGKNYENVEKSLLSHVAANATWFYVD